MSSIIKKLGDVISSGKSGGQTINGGTGASENLTLSSTANATKGKIILGTQSVYDEVNDSLTISSTTGGVNRPFQILKTYTNGTATQPAINILTDTQVSGTGIGQTRGILATIKNSSTTSGTGVLSGGLIILQANGSQNYTTNNFTNLSLSVSTLVGQVGTIVDTNVIRVNSPSFAGTKPTNVFGIQIFNQGVGGVTTSNGLYIAAQSGSTNNYAIIVAGAGNSGFGTSSPVSKVTVTGGDVEITDSASGTILKSPNGTRFRITVDNAGSLIVTSL